ncbi:hypothetical protein CEXT_7751 [Caerostris extrusa]|uniref:Uncharacterized protein n=1 Tax=Caerostris extrusa TaxID=172846 RepID=A0AAV4XZH9_CAEEX|nr:hypothetical protein CEXT_7751 [Caerostris extrusa]
MENRFKIRAEPNTSVSLTGMGFTNSCSELSFLNKREAKFTLSQNSLIQDSTDTSHHEWLQLGPNTNSNSILYEMFSPETACNASTATGASIKFVVSSNGDDSESAASHKVSYEIHGAFCLRGNLMFELSQQMFRNCCRFAFLHLSSETN